MNVNPGVAEALDLLGAAYRGDWSDFDGRTLRAQLQELSGVLRDGATFDVRRWAFEHGICPESHCWFEHCRVRPPAGRWMSCAHADDEYFHVDGAS